jgi:hypothetical protein
VSATASAGPTASDEPFVETRAGGLFFLNCVLAAPALVVLWPVLVRAGLRGIGAVAGPSALLDPIPAVATEVGPAVAWLAVVPLATTVRNLRMPLPAAARWTLRGFAAMHAGVLVWWMLRLLA